MEIKYGEQVINNPLLKVVVTGQLWITAFSWPEKINSVHPRWGFGGGKLKVLSADNGPEATAHSDFQPAKKRKLFQRPMAKISYKSCAFEK